MSASGRRLPERGVINVMDYGAVGNDSTDNVTALNAAIAALPTSSPIRGGELHFPPGVYRISAGLTIPANEDGIHIKFVGLGGATSTNGDFGARLKATAGSITMLSFVGSALSQGGPVFEDFGLDGGGQASVVGVLVQKVNRLQARNLTISRCATGLQIDSLVDVSGSNDSSWHYLDGCEFYNNTTSINVRHSYGFTMNGGKIVHAATGTGINIGTVGSVVASQHVQIYGTKIDGCTTGITTAGGHSHFAGMGFEGCTTGVAITTAGGTVSGNFNTVTNCAFSNGTSAVTVGTGCVSNLIGPNSTSSVTNEVTYADATARRRNAFIQAYPDTGAYPGNLSLATCRTVAPADGDLAASQVALYFDDTNGTPLLKAKCKTANGTVVSKTITWT